jgi:outer membrane protein assembly factor BamB
MSAIAGLSAYDVRTGKELWTCPGSGFSNTTSTPVLGDGLLLVPNGNVVALRLGTGKARPESVWQASRLRPNISSPLYYAKRVYALNPPNVLVCADAADGKLLWQERLATGTYWSSPVAADGKIYAVSDAGTTTVVQAGDRPKLLAKNALDDPILASPAVAGGCLFMRSDRHVYCVGSGRVP